MVIVFGVVECWICDDELFEGEKAELAKQRAISIATVMQLKLVHGNALIKNSTS